MRRRRPQKISLNWSPPCSSGLDFSYPDNRIGEAPVSAKAMHRQNVMAGLAAAWFLGWCPRQQKSVIFRFLNSAGLQRSFSKALHFVARALRSHRVGLIAACGGLQRFRNLMRLWRRPVPGSVLERAFAEERLDPGDGLLDGIEVGRNRPRFSYAEATMGGRCDAFRGRRHKRSSRSYRHRRGQPRPMITPSSSTRAEERVRPS